MESIDGKCGADCLSDRRTTCLEHTVWTFEGRNKRGVRAHTLNGGILRKMRKHCSRPVFGLRLASFVLLD